MSEYKHKLQDFFSNNIIWYLAISAVVAFICHGAMLFSDAIGIDGELAVLNIEAYDYQGRPGVHWIRRLFEVNGFNLYATEVITFILLILAPFAFLLLFHLADENANKSKWYYVPFIIAFISSPFWCAQLYFLSQSVPVMVTLLLIPVACFLVDYCVVQMKTKRIPAIMAGVLAVFFVFLMTTVYQVQLIIYVLCVCTLFMVKSSNTDLKAKNNILWIFTSILVLALALGLYGIVVKCFYSEDLSYLGSQIGWSSVGLRGGLSNIFHVMKSALKGESIYSRTFFPTFVLLFVLSAINLFGYEKERRTGNKFFLLLVEIVIFMTPFAFPILYGQDVSPRMRYVFPIAEACIIYLLCREIKKLYENLNVADRKYIKGFFIGISACCISFFLKENIDLADYCNQLYYTNEYRYEQDCSIAQNVKSDIETYISENELDRERVLSHLVFLGQPDIYYNEMCLPNLAVMGSSFWRWDNLAYMVRYRIYYFMDVCGFGIGEPPYYSDGAKIAYYLYFQDYFGENVEQMNAYPNSGYIQYMADEDLGLDYLVVKLGNDWDAEINYNKASFMP